MHGEIDFECTADLEASGFDLNTVAISFGEDDELYVNDPFMSPQELLDEVTRLFSHIGFVRLSCLPQDIERGAPPKINLLIRMVAAVRMLTVKEVAKLVP